MDNLKHYRPNPHLKNLGTKRVLLQKENKFLK